MTLDEYARAVAVAECERIHRCRSGGSGMSVVREVLGFDRCVLEMLPDFGTYEALIDAGTVRFDPEAAVACLEGDHGDCLPSHRKECLHVFAGTVRDGAPCVRDAQCVSGFCASTDTPNCGLCTPALREGEPCDRFSDSIQCAPGGECTSPTGSGPTVCVFQVGYGPTRQVTVGEDCADLAATCEPGSFCDGSVCRPFLAMGAPCDPRLDPCVAGTLCAGSVTGDFLCLPAHRVGTAGSTCGVADAKAYECDPEAGLVCDFDRHCVRQGGTGQIGEPCRYAFQCLGHRCGGSPGTCQGPKAAVGVPCAVDDDCASGLCDYVDPEPLCRDAYTCTP